MLGMFKALAFTLLGEHRAEDTKYQSTTLSTLKMQPWPLMKINSNHSVWQRLGCLEGGRMHQNNTNKRGIQTMLKIFRTVIFVVLGEQGRHVAINYVVPTSQDCQRGQKVQSYYFHNTLRASRGRLKCKHATSKVMKLQSCPPTENALKPCVFTMLWVR